MSDPFTREWNKPAPTEELKRENPYLYDYLTAYQSKDIVVIARAVDACRKKYAFAVPDGEAIRLIAEHSKEGIVEIGAGSGYWAWMLAKRKLPIRAYDARISWRKSFWKRRWFPVEDGNADKAAEHPEKTLLLVWPPYDDKMAYEALRCYHRAGGKMLCFVGEGYGGCTADDDFFEALAGIKPIMHEIPQWYGLHDEMRIYDLEGLCIDS